MRVAIGTSGYSYPAWRGSFYPPKLPAKEMLAYYATRFGSVEINNTFYRLPSAALVAGWAKEVPAGFTFACKAPQAITHHKRLVGAEEVTAALVAAVAHLGAAEGPLLFQLPPHLKQDLPRLERFLKTLPAGTQGAFEFRHPSWFGDATYATLAAAGAALCIAESDELTTPLVATADWGYLRLRRGDYSEAELAAWARSIAAESRWQRAFVYFKHEDAGKGPRFAEALGRHFAG